MGNICHIDFTFRGKEKIGIDLDSNANLDEKLKSIRKFLANSKGERSPLTNDDDRISIIYRNKGRVYELDLYVYMSYDVKKMILLDISDPKERFPDSITTISPHGEYTINYERVQHIDIEKKDRGYKFCNNRTSIDKKYGIWVNYQRLPYSVIPSEEQKDGDLSKDVRRVRKTLEKRSDVLIRAKRLKDEADKYEPYFEKPLKLVEIISLIESEREAPLKLPQVRFRSKDFYLNPEDIVSEIDYCIDKGLTNEADETGLEP